jgi:prolipoprotein diacylglyceryl transferase
MIAFITPPANRVIFSLFGIDIMWYGVLIAVGIFLGVFVGGKMAERFGVSEDDFSSMMIWAIVAAIIGARLYYVLFSLDYYLAHPAQIINIREGGLAIHGGILAAVLVAYLYARKKKLPFLNLADAAMPGLALGQSIGRWGNFFNQEAYGGPTDLPWGMWINGTTVHPTFLYESIVTFALPERSIEYFFSHVFSLHRNPPFYHLVYYTESVSALRTKNTARTVSCTGGTICSDHPLQISFPDRLYNRFHRPAVSLIGFHNT